MKETTTPPPARHGAIFRPDGSLKLPDPVLPPSAKELENKRAKAADALEGEPLPTDWKAALELQKKINKLPANTPGKEARLKRITRHVAELQQGTPPPPPLSITEMHRHLFGRKATDSEISTARKALLGKAAKRK